MEGNDTKIPQITTIYIDTLVELLRILRSINCATRWLQDHRYAGMQNVDRREEEIDGLPGPLQRLLTRYTSERKRGLEELTHRAQTSSTMR